MCPWRKPGVPLPRSGKLRIRCRGNGLSTTPPLPLRAVVRGAPGATCRRTGLVWMEVPFLRRVVSTAYVVGLHRNQVEIERSAKAHTGYIGVGAIRVDTWRREGFERERIFERCPVQKT